MVNIGHCVVNAGSFVINCVGAWCRCRVSVGLCAVNVGCRCVRTSDLYLVIARSTIGDFVCVWMSIVGPWLFNVGLGVVSCIG